MVSSSIFKLVNNINNSFNSKIVNDKDNKIQNQFEWISDCSPLVQSAGGIFVLASELGSLSSEMKAGIPNREITGNRI